MKKPLLSLLLLPLLGFAGDPPPSVKPQGGVNYPSNFQVANGVDLFVQGEYLYWAASEEGLYFAQDSSTPGMDFNGKLARINPKWDSGFRVGTGLNFPKQGMDLTLLWTYFSTSAHKTAQGDLLLVLWAHPDLTATRHADFAKARWRIDLNTLDLEVGRSCWFGGHFSFRPFIGLRAALIDQALNTEYLFATTPALLGKVHTQSDFQGGGVRAGADLRFTFGPGFAVYGLASGALLYGKFEADFREKEEKVLIARAKDHFLQGVSALQIGAGIGWDTHFAKDRCHIELHIGWEQNSWGNANQMNHFLGELQTGRLFEEHSHLSFQGLVAGGRFDF
ncbi:MAG: hypothetical protein JSS61_01220 [Verrucomicrobia bacterium]|nr:hypothetical protein [Verrucomicrobiota bacterium]